VDLTRISACSYPFRDRPWAAALTCIKQAGFGKVDLLGRAPHLSLDPRECAPQAIQQAAESLGLRIANLGAYVGRGFGASDAATAEAELAQLQRAVDIAAMFGARSIRVSPGDDDPAHIDRIAPWFRRAAAYAAEKDVYLAFETHGGGISGQPARCVELAEAVGSAYFGVLYDPCNLMHGGMDYRMALWTMREHIAHVHLKDGAVDKDGFRLTMLGEGHLDLRWIVEMLDAIGYRGDLALEYELGQPDPEEGLALWLGAAEAI
jgi:sugar phosphate isomerase/epimerase